MEWKESNSQPYLYLNCPDYYNLGVLKAQNLSRHYIFFDYILKKMIKNLDIPFEYCHLLANAYARYIPENYKKEIQGIVDTISKLNYEDIVFAKAFFDGFYGKFFPDMVNVTVQSLPFGGCTVLASKNIDNSITIGQTIDLSYFLKDTINFILFKVKRINPVFTMNVGPCHLMGTTKRVTSVLNLVETSVPGEVCIPTSIKRRMALETSKNAFDYQKIMVSNGFASSWNWVIGDMDNNVITCESIPAVYSERILTNGEICVKSNTYANLEFTPYLIKPDYSIKRQKKAEELALKAMNDGILTLEELLGDILSFRDGSDASITRMPEDDSNNPIKPCTVAFLGRKGRNIVFGIGNPLESKWGQIPF